MEAVSLQRINKAQKMAVIAATPDRAIELHDDYGFMIVETDYDACGYHEQQWWEIDLTTGYLTKQVVMH